jgi:DNA-binding NarL/FixJ family response regulator
MLLSKASHAVLVDELLPDIAFRDLDEHQLKDLDRPERIYQLVVPDLQREFPPLRTVGTSSQALAVPFAGREGEFAEIVLSSAPRNCISLVIADDSVLLREGVGRLLEDAGFDVVGRAGDAEELVSQVSTTRPAVAITDIKMPPSHTDEGLVAAERIRSLHPETGVLVLSQYLDSRYAMRLLEHYPERVGYLLKDRVSDLAVLSDAIRRVADGECVLDPTIVSQLMKGTHAEGPLSELSEHERELLALTAEGRSNKAIAVELGRSEDTVEAELDAVFTKIGLGATADDLRRIVPVLEFLRTS